MEGYEIITETISIKSGQNYEISLKDAEEAYTIINPLVNSGIADYTLQIGDKTYKPGDEIKLQQRTYTVKAEAEGCEPWSKEISCLNKVTYNLNISFVQNPVPTETPTLQEETPTDRKSTPLNSSHIQKFRMPSSA